MLQNNYIDMTKKLRQKKVVKMTLMGIIYILILIVAALMTFAIIQIKSIGLNVKDFWSFIEANQILDKLYITARKYEKLSVSEQVMFLGEAEKVFKAYDKVPNMLWEEEYDKYNAILEAYRDIRILRWSAV